MKKSLAHFLWALPPLTVILGFAAHRLWYASPPPKAQLLRKHESRKLTSHVSALELHDTSWIFGFPNKVADLTNGTVINLEELGCQERFLTIRAVVEGAASSIRFGIDSDDSVRVNSFGVPYLCGALFGMLPYACNRVCLGQHTVTATPFSGWFGSGDVGSSLAVTFSIVHSVNPDLACPVPMVRTWI
jgi:hypothetical protein